MGGSVHGSIERSGKPPVLLRGITVIVGGIYAVTEIYSQTQRIYLLTLTVTVRFAVPIVNVIAYVPGFENFTIGLT